MPSIIKTVLSLSVTVTFAIGATGCTLATDLTPASQPGSVKVLKVADGDTITVKLDGKREKVRLALIDAPESYALRLGHSECGGKEAKAWLKHKVSGKRVTLSRPSSENVDRYGRLIREVHLHGKSIDLQLAKAGWAKPYTVGTSADKAIKRAANTAHTQNKGVWKLCGGFGHANH